jgi:putative hydrolase of the HAD superfamily
VPPVEGFVAYQEESGISMEDLGRAMTRAAERYGDHPLFELERGHITEDEFRRRLEDGLGGRFRLERLRDVYFDRLDPNPRMIDFMRDLRRRGLRMALCTNNVREWEPLWRAKLPELDQIFEVVVDSAFVGMRKPEQGIYELTLQRLGHVRAEDCLFVDDLEVNCEAARALGMRALRFESTDQAISDVEAALDGR